MNKNCLKRFSALITLVLFASSSLIGCSGQSSTSNGASASSAATSAAASASTGTAASGANYKIGLNNFYQGDYSLDILQASAKFACDSVGCNLIGVNDEGKIDKITTDVQNMIASGDQGILFFGLTENLFPVVSKLCENAKIPFALYDKIPSSQAEIESLKNNPYFVGAVGTQDYQAGVEIGDAAVKDGLKKALVVAAQDGDPTHTPRIEGFTKTFEAGGGKVEGVVHCENVADATTKADDLLTAHSDVDCVYGTGGDFGSGALTALKSHSNVKAKAFVTDLQPAILKGLEGGTVSAANGGQFVDVEFCVGLLRNYLDGHPIKDSDGKSPILNNLPFVTVPVSQVNLYNKFWVDGQPYSADEIKNWCFSWNKNVSIDTYKTAIKNYSLSERLNQKVKEGKITQADLDKAGIK